MPDLWTTVIGIVERQWKEKPRKNLLAALVSVRANMLNCQFWYEKYRALGTEGNADELWEVQNATARAVGTQPSPHPKMTWLDALQGLGVSLRNLDSVLSIFSPETRDQISNYYGFESTLVDDVSVLGTATVELGPSGIGITTPTLDASFKAGIEKVNTFIKDNFTPEEVFAAAQHSSYKELQG